MSFGSDTPGGSVDFGGEKGTSTAGSGSERGFGEQLKDAIMNLFSPKVEVPPELQRAALNSIRSMGLNNSASDLSKAQDYMRMQDYRFGDLRDTVNTGIGMFTNTNPLGLGANLISKLLTGKSMDAHIGDAAASGYFGLGGIGSDQFEAPKSTDSGKTEKVSKAKKQPTAEEVQKFIMELQEASYKDQLLAAGPVIPLGFNQPTVFDPPLPGSPGEMPIYYR